MSDNSTGIIRILKCQEVEDARESNILSVFPFFPFNSRYLKFPQGEETVTEWVLIPGINKQVKSAKLSVKVKVKGE